MHEREILHKIAQRFRSILGENLTGVYVHGSVAFGCFCWEKSDLDFLTVVRTEPSLEEKIALIAALLALEPQCPPRGVEMSVVLERHCRSFVYPTPFVLHYSNAHLARCRTDLETFCREMHGADPDLAAHFTVTRAVGFPVLGPPVTEVFAPVPRAAYVDSIWRDVADAAGEAARNPVYYLLNLCRVLAFLTEGQVFSNVQGGTWGLSHLPLRWKPLLTAALHCNSGEEASLDADEVCAFSKELLRRIAECRDTAADV